MSAKYDSQRQRSHVVAEKRSKSQPAAAPLSEPGLPAVRRTAHHLHRSLRSAGAGVLTVTPVLVWGQAFLWPSVAAGAVTGAATYVLVTTFTTVRVRAGNLTAVAAASVMSALMWAVVVAVAPDCPGRLNPTSGAALDGRCTPAEVGTYTLVGLLLPVTVAVLVLPALFITRSIRRAARWAGLRRRS